MQKIALKCDVCDGPLTMQSGGQMAVCDYCGTRYALERLREKVQEIRGKVSIDGPVKTSHEDFEIHAGVLTKYHGADTEITIPANVKEIASDWIIVGRDYITSVVLPQELTKINDRTFAGFKSLEQISLPDGIVCIGYKAFAECVSLREINIPDTVIQVSSGAFWNCSKLNNVILSIETHNRLCPQIEKDIFGYCTWEWTAFSSNGGHYNGAGIVGVGTPSIMLFSDGLAIEWDEYNHKSISFDSDEFKNNTAPWFQQVVAQMFESVKAKQKEQWKYDNRCQYCGGNFKGVFTKTCEKCGRSKDY